MVILYTLALALFSATCVNSLNNQLDFSSDPNFSALRTCGNCCLCVGTNCTASQCIRTPVGCENNVCLCNSASLAFGYLDTCVRAACVLQPDEAALSYKNMFSSYCQNLPTSTTTSMTPTVTVTPTSTSSSPSDTLSQTTTQLAIPLGVGLGVGIPAVLIALFFGYYTIKQHTESRLHPKIRELEMQIQDRNAEDAATLRNLKSKFAALDAPTQARVAGLIGN